MVSIKHQGWCFMNNCCSLLADILCSTWWGRGLWRVLLGWQGIQHFPPNILVFSQGPERYNKVMTALRIWTYIFWAIMAWLMLRASFGVLNAPTLCCTCAWASLFNSRLKCHFSLQVLCLKGSYFNGQGIRLLLQLPLTVGLTSDALAYFHSLHRELILMHYVYWGHGLEACIYTPSFFTLFPIS